MKFKILLMAILLFPCYLMAQEEQAKKLENVDWYWIIHLKFKIDKKAEAHEIIKNYWRPIENKIGREQNVYEFETGDWDLIRVVKMEEGISTMEWELSPMGIEYNKEFLKIAGSEESMNEVRKKWSECLQESKTEIAKTFIPD